MAGADLVQVLAVGGEHRLVREHVDASREPAGRGADAANRRGAENARATVARRAQAKVDVLGHFTCAERIEPEVLGDPVLELTHVASGEHGIELGLAEQHDLQQLLLRGFKVREQADLFERGRRHRMRFVHQRDDASPGGES